jgi:hypothetical protein
VKPPIGYYRGLKSPQSWLSDFNNYVQLTEIPAFKWAPLLANQVEDPGCKAAIMESEKLPYEDDFQHFSRLAQDFLDWFQTSVIESDHAISRLSRVRKQIDEPFDAFVSRYEQCVSKAHPTGDLGERNKIRLLIEGLEPDISRTWYSAATQYQGEVYQTTVAYLKTLYVNRDPLLTRQYMFEYIRHDRLLHRSEGPSIIGSLVDIATRTHAPSVVGLMRPSDYHHSALLALAASDPFATPPIQLETIRQYEKELAQAEGRPSPFHSRSRQSAAAAPTDQMDATEAPTPQQPTRQPRKRAAPDSQDSQMQRRPRNVNAVKPERPSIRVTRRSRTTSAHHVAPVSTMST